MQNMSASLTTLLGLCVRVCVCVCVCVCMCVTTLCNQHATQQIASHMRTVQQCCRFKGCKFKANPTKTGIVHMQKMSANVQTLQVWPVCCQLELCQTYNIKPSNLSQFLINITRRINIGCKIKLPHWILRSTHLKPDTLCWPPLQQHGCCANSIRCNITQLPHLLQRPSHTCDQIHVPYKDTALLRLLLLLLDQRLLCSIPNTLHFEAGSSQPGPHNIIRWPNSKYIAERQW